MTWVGTYLVIYSVIAFFYIWYRYSLVYLNRKSDKGNYSGFSTIVIPFYNEKEHILRNCIQSVIETSGNKEIFVIDDHSEDSNVFKIMKDEFSFSNNIKFKRLEKHSGKRKAQEQAFREASGDIIITVDSDTILKWDAIKEIIKPFSDRRIGAVTGNIGVINEDQNLLTRVLAARYWNAFNMERNGQSAFGKVTCCTGVFSAYRKDIIHDIIDKYVNQEFLGEECTYGDDRHLTNLILKEGYDVIYSKKAYAKTYVPDNMRQLISQQNRWKKSFLRENLIMAKWGFHKSKFLTFDSIFTFIMPFISLIVRGVVFITILLYPLYFIWFIGIIAFMGLLRCLYLIKERGLKGIYGVLYGFIHEAVIYWTLFYAIVRLKDTSWGTR